MDRLHTNIVLRTTSRFKSIVLVFIVIISFQIPQHSFTSQTSRSLLEINAIIFPPLSVYQVLQHYLSIKSLRYTKRGLHKLSTITCNQSINQSSAAHLLNIIIRDRGSSCDGRVDMVVDSRTDRISPTIRLPDG